MILAAAIVAGALVAGGVVDIIRAHRRRQIYKLFEQDIKERYR